VTSTYLLSNNTQVAGTISASIDSTFMSLFGYPQLPFTVDTVAEIGGSYADIHFLIDTSGSMGIPESAAGVSKLKSVFDPYGTGGCSFACHSAGTNNTGLYSGKTGYAFAQQYGIYLREDRLRDSLMAMLEKIAAVPAASNIRISLDTISGTTPKALVQNVDLPTAREAIKALTFPGSATDIDGVLDLYAGQWRPRNRNRRRPNQDCRHRDRWGFTPECRRQSGDPGQRRVRQLEGHRNSAIRVEYHLP
jgi:hypothetical protein